MTAYSMPALPDCAVCGSPVSLVIDNGGPREECVGCGVAQKPIPPPVDRAEVRRDVRESRRRLLGPSCYGRRHLYCTASGCQCRCHEEGGDGAA